MPNPIQKRGSVPPFGRRPGELRGIRFAVMESTRGLHLTAGMVALLVLLATMLASCGSDAHLLGRDLFDRSCAVCHSADGSGGFGLDIGPGSNAALNLSDDQIAGVIRVGPGNMPGFSRFTDEQVASLVQYVRSLEAGTT